MKAKTFLICTIALSLVVLGTMACVIFYLDPLFHFRAPRPGYYYDLPEQYERLQNDGILRNFDYDGVITGSSMCQNFMTTQAEELFGGRFVKTCFSGGTWKEISDNLRNAFEYNPDIKIVIQGVDYNMLLWDKDKLSYDPSQYPKFTGKAGKFNDIEYLLNKTVLYDYVIGMIENRIAGTPPGVKPFDEYENFTADAMNAYGYGYDAFVGYYGDLEYQGPGKRQELSDEEIDNIRKSVEANFISLANDHPDTVFYLFITPYSIYNWMLYSQDGITDKMIDAETVMIAELLKCENIRLYSFNDNKDLVCDLDNFSDKMHFGENVNTMILNDIKDGTGLLTEDNYLDYIDRERKLYDTYDYYSIAKEASVVL